MMCTRRSIAFGLLLLGFFVSLADTCRAEMIITIGGGSIDPGGSLTLDIGIESDAPPENLAEYELILQITPLTGSGGSSLQFVDPNSETYLEDADYVFAATSESIAFDESTGLLVSPSEISYYDASVDGAGFLLNVPVTSGQKLATVTVSHVLGGASPQEVAGDQFTFAAGPNTFFANTDSFDELGYQFVSGTVTVNAVAIPEPSSVALLMVCGGGLLVRRRRR